MQFHWQFCGTTFYVMFGFAIYSVKYCPCIIQDNPIYNFAFYANNLFHASTTQLLNNLVLVYVNQKFTMNMFGEQGRFGI